MRAVLVLDPMIAEQRPSAVKKWLPTRYDQLVADIAEKAPCPARWLDLQNDRLRMQRANGTARRIAGRLIRWDAAGKKPSDYLGNFCVPLFVKILIFLFCCTPTRGANVKTSIPDTWVTVLECTP
jgi:hypothetical protein